MKINRNNYEAYMLDYFEKELDPASVAELMLFLEQNPDLKEEFEGFENISVVPDLDITFPDKISLKKNIIYSTADINPKNYEEFFIAAVENLLSDAEISQLNSFLALNPELIKDYSLFKQTKLQPDTSIVFGDKESLRRKTIVPFYRVPGKALIYTTLAVAASLLIFVAVYTSIPRLKNSPSIAGVVKQEDIHKPVIPAPGNNNDTQPVKVVPVTTTGIENIQAASYSVVPEKSTALADVRTKENIPQPVMLQASSNNQLHNAFSTNTLVIAPGTDTRSYFTDIYKYIRLREEVDYQQYLDDQESKPFFARTVNMVREKVFGWDCNDVQKTTADKSLWAIAAAGVKGINYLTNSNIEIHRKTDTDGNTTAYAIASGHFEYSRDLRK